jgi:hypothetical protein
MTQSEQGWIDWRKMIIGTAMILGGAFLFIYGEIDDSPGGQLLGLFIVVSGVSIMIRARTRGQRQSK